MSKFYDIFKSKKKKKSKESPKEKSFNSTEVEKDGQKKSNSFNLLLKPVLKAVEAKGYSEPTLIQAKAIPVVLEGHDLIGCAQTGTGKTAAFTLPILHKLFEKNHKTSPNKPKVLMLAPTRELAQQIADSIQEYGRFTGVRHTVVYGGVSQKRQVHKLNRGVDILVATPGRLLDLMNQGFINLKQVRHFILDEADRMLDMGFIHDIRNIAAKLPEQKQVLFFSATMGKKERQLAETMVVDPKSIVIAPEKPAVERINQKVYFVDRDNKFSLLADLLGNNDLYRVIVFTETKRAADRLAKKLDKNGVSADAIHGDKSQAKRMHALRDFKKNKTRVLVATDVAARGIDVDSVTHVVNYDLPNEAETYVHRIGRTARAGQDGDAISFCSATERDYLRSIERLLRESVPFDDDHEYHSESAQKATGSKAKPAPRGGGRGRFNSRKGQGSKPGARRRSGNGKSFSGNSSDRKGGYGKKRSRSYAKA